MAGPDGSISIDHGSIEAQARNLGDLKNELENAVQSTTGQIQSLYDSGAFKGLSGSSFQEIFTRWNKESGDLFAVIDEFVTYLGKASSAFSEVDQAFTIKL